VQSEITGLCQALENLADTLNESGAGQKCLVLARSIAPVIIRCHRLEEEVLFPEITIVSRSSASARRAIDILRADHLEDECFAEELQEALLDYGEGSSALSADALGYLLRSFFLAERRHLALEMQLLLPLISAGRESESG
jgi:hypothetical protein